MKKFKIDFKTCLVFIVSVLVFHLIGSSIFPVDEETNILLAPGWYPIACMLFAMGMSLLFYNRKTLLKGKKRADSTSDDLTEDIEEWKKERGRTNAPPYTTNPIPTGNQSITKNPVSKPIQSLPENPIDQSSESLETTFRSPREKIDYLQQIKEMENRFKNIYIFTQEKSLNSHKRERVFLSLCKKYETMELSLPCQIRFEQLKIEYETKFMNPDPIAHIDTMEGHDFEYWCADLLKKLAYRNVEVTPGSGDQGADILAEKEGVRYVIQCKCYSRDLGNEPIQEVEAGRIYYGCHVGVVMTNRHFTKGAKALAEKTGTLLWDRDFLIQAIGVQ